MIQRPAEGEYKPYFQGYIDLVPEGDFLDLLYKNTAAATAMLQRIPVEKHNYQYAPDKWTIKELLMHVIDIERVFCYRALVASRGDDKTQLYPVDDHLYVKNAQVQGRLYDDMVAEFKAVRNATEKLFESMSASQSKFKADAISAPITARALGYIIIGHVMHHMNILESRYL